MKINKKIKAFMSIIIACFMCVGVLLSIKTDVYADSSKEYVYDNAGILTSDEVSKLKSQCKKASEDSECDIVIITTNIGHDGSTMDSYLKKFLDDNGYSQNAVIYGVDMKSRADRMYTQGKAKTDISQGTIDDIREACEEKLSDKDYYKAFSKYVKNMNTCMTMLVVIHVFIFLTYVYDYKHSQETYIQNVDKASHCIRCCSCSRSYNDA